MRSLLPLLVVLALGGPDAGASSVRALPAAPAPAETGPVLLPPPTAELPVAREMLPGMARVAGSGSEGDLEGWAFTGHAIEALPMGGELLPGLHLQVVPDDRVRWGPYAGVRVRLVHGGPGVAALFGQDYRLDLVQQAHIDGEWVAVEHLPRSWCGNSYNPVALPSGYAATFDLPRYGGPQRVLLRAALLSEDPPVVSRPWWGGITPGQAQGVAGARSVRTLVDPGDW